MAYLSSKLAFLALLALAAAALGAAQNSPQDFVRQHNMARAAVGIGPVHWDNNVAAYARRYAARRQRDCMQVHSSNGPYGENIFVGSARRAWSASDVVDMWMAEKRYYRYGNNSCSAPAGKSCGHYTQMMWRASTAIGCAHVVCDNNGGVFIVCSYSPRGNHRGRRPY